METGSTPLALWAGVFGGWEIVLVLAVILILIGARGLLAIAEGLGRGLSTFKDATKDVDEEIQGALDEKLPGTVYEALTVDNTTAEFVYPDSSKPDRLRAIILFLAEGLGLGRIAFGREIIGVVAGLGWFLVLLATRSYAWYVLGMFAGLAVAGWVCRRAVLILNDSHPPSVILDRIVAAPLCFLPWVASNWPASGGVRGIPGLFENGSGLVTICLLLITYRVVTVLVASLLRRKWTGCPGWGLVLDDVVAAVVVGLVSASG